MLFCFSILLAAYSDKGVHYAMPPEAEPPVAPLDSPPSLPYPIKDRQGDFVTDQPNNPFYLKDPSAIQESVDWDPTSGMYVLTEKVAGQDVKPPQYMTYDEYLKYTEKQDMDSYWKERADAVHLIEDKGIVPPIQLKNQFVDRLFGGSKIEIRPQGNVDMTLGANLQTTANPNIPIRNRRTGGFDFDMNINVNVIGKIGDKLQLGVKYNTQSGFQFDNTVKVGYTGGQDDIIKSIEAGNVSLPLPTRLITGSQSLFGLKTKLQFGRLTWTTVISQQQSKKQSITLNSGAQTQNFSVNSDQYDENKDFLLSQYFHNTFNYALSGLPNIRSEINITRIEVWVTNRTGATQNVRNVVGMMDLGETTPYSGHLRSTSSKSYPDNSSNNLYSQLVRTPSNRFVGNVVTALQGAPFEMVQGQDFENTYARLLNPNEFTFNAKLGFITLNSQPNPNDIVAVAFQYEVNGQVYQVGEFGDQVPPDSNSTPKVLFLKLLKGSADRTDLPIWNLMMKNVYSLGAYNISPTNFRLDVYYNDPGGGLKPYMPKGCLEGEQLIHVLNCDNLDINGNPGRDGLFDFLPGIDILPQNGRLIFPILEPFGKDLTAAFTSCGSGDIASQYVYQQLYDSIKYTAQQYPQYNRFVIKGQYTGAGSSNVISLGAGNIPRGSVVVTAGGQTLTEGVQYTVDYNLGRVTILDQGILNSGQQIKVSFENNNLFATQTQSLIANRLDYKISPKFNIGSTILQLSEKPFTQKVNIGEDPIKNTMLGFDLKYETNLPWLTKALNVWPFYKTKEMSTLSTYGEFAYLKPGHSKAINDPNHQPQVYIDDFEGTSTGYDLKQPITNWKMASTPRNHPGQSSTNLFPEASLINNAVYGYNRAKLSWYQIDNSFFNQQTSPAAVYNNSSGPYGTNDNYTRLINYSEVFPNTPISTLDQNLYSLDLSYYPNQRGPYNYECLSGSDPTLPHNTYGLNNDGTLKSPQQRWGGIMTAMSNTDFVSTNVAYIDFWLLDPFLKKDPAQTRGYLYIDLGTISEDILRDSRQAFENGLSANPQGTEDETFWGWVPKIPPLVNAFDNDPSLRPVQDVGLDGLSDVAERSFKAGFLTNVSSTLSGVGGASALAALENDPSSDDYLYYLDPSLNNVGSILYRYKNYQGVEGNSPVQTNSIETTAGTSLPDKEDLNNDNTLNEDEAYFSYEIPLYSGMNSATDPQIVTDQAGVADYTGTVAQWHEFRIPIANYTSQVGGIPDFQSIQFMRMFLTGFQDSIILRFGTLQLVRNQWRTYNLPLDDPCENLATDDAQTAYFNVTSVGIENNATKQPVNYVLPPGILRQQALGAQTNQYIAQDEQSLAVSVCDLKDCQTKAVFKNMPLDLRNYDRLEMFIHANRIEGEVAVKDSQVTAFIRLGSDFTDNYYQYEIPLVITPDNVGSGYSSSVLSDQYAVWPDSNNMNVTLQNFVLLKEKRNATSGYPLNVPFSQKDGSRIMTIVGNPDLGGVKTVMLGIRNPGKADPNNPLRGSRTSPDNGQAICVEVWFDELRLNGFNQAGGVAALATANVKVADLGTVALAGNMHTAGFGQVDQTLDQRFKDNLYSYNFTTGLELGKLLPSVLGLRLPFYANYSQSFSTPQYDPYQLDIKSNVQIGIIRNTYGDDSAHIYARQIRTTNTNHGFNFTNVRFVPKTKKKKPQIYDPGNFNFTYAYNETGFTDPYTIINAKKTWLGIVGWNFAPQSKDLTPFRKLVKAKTKWLDFIRDIGFNPVPSSLSVTSNMNRLENIIQYRPLGDIDFTLPITYARSFNWSRAYALKWNPFKALSIDFSANDKAFIDEPDSLENTRALRQQVLNNVWAGGRNISYTQNLGVNYNIPINKIPILDFITANVGYNATYSWTALPWEDDTLRNGSLALAQNTQGNIINNTQSDRAKVDFNFKKLYDKNPFLKVYDSPNPTVGDKKENDKKRTAYQNAREKMLKEIEKLEEQRDKLIKSVADAKEEARGEDPDGKKAGEVIRLKTELKRKRKEIRMKKKEYREKQAPSNPIISLFVRPLLMVKKATAEYTINQATTMPGFQGYSEIFGNQLYNNGYTKIYNSTTQTLSNSSFNNAPGWGFVFGAQPGDNLLKGMNNNTRTAWLSAAAQKGWLSTDTFLNQQYTQTRTEHLGGTVSLEPYPDFKIDINITRDVSTNFSEFFKYVPTENGSTVDSMLNPMVLGSYTISYLPIRTMFAKVDQAGYTQTYNTFMVNRIIISQRLGKINPNSEIKGQSPYYYNPSDSMYNTAYAAGYGPLSQDVLIPAFLAAYNKQNPNTIGLNPFNSVPMPNWKIAYTGFSKFKWIQKYLTNLTISSGYSSTLTVSSYQTNLSYMGDGTLFGAKLKDSIAGNFYSLYNLPSIMINESFSPLIGIDLTTKNNIQAKFLFSMSRTLTMSFADFQLLQMNSKSITVGGGYKIKGLKLPIRINGRKIRLNNDLNFRFDFSYRDNIVINYLIDQGAPQITQGARTITIQPNVDYTVSKQLDIKLFFDQTATVPKISSSYPTTNTKAGITFRFNLAQ